MNDKMFIIINTFTHNFTSFYFQNLKKQKYLFIFIVLRSSTYSKSNNATEKFNTNLESSEPGLQDRLYLKLLGPTLESKKGLEDVTMDFIGQYCRQLDHGLTDRQTYLHWYLLSCYRN